MHALSIASFGYLSNNPALLGYVIDFTIESELVPIPPYQPYYDYASGGGTIVSGGWSEYKKRITVKFKYKENTYEETKYVASHIEIGVDDIEIRVISELPTITFKNLEVKYGNINPLQKQARNFHLRTSN